MITNLLAFLLVVSPILMGSVHTPIYCGITGIVLLGLFACKNQPVLPLECKMLLGLGTLAFLLSIFFGSFRTEPDTILGTIAVGAQPMLVLQALVMLVSIYAVSVLTSCAFLEGHREKIEHWLIISGFIVALIALVHLFYDTGKLFWLFEPDSVFLSARARWPFVNSNHLGHFLLIPFFLLLPRMASDLHALAYLIIKKRDAEQVNVVIIKKLWQSSLFAVIALVVLVSLSRGAWLGITAGIIVYTLTSRLRYLQMLVPLVAISLLFLIDGLADRLADRLSYTAQYASQDLRLSLVEHSWPLLKEYWVFGAGFGAWLPVFMRQAPAMFGESNPEYLHCDPLQWIIETGIPGALFLLLLTSILIRRLSYAPALASGLIALSVASFFDFPFRIPAILWQAVVGLTLLTSLEPATAREPSVESPVRRSRKVRRKKVFVHD